MSIKKLITTFTDFPVDEIITSSRIIVLRQRHHSLMPWDERRSTIDDAETNLEIYLSMLAEIEDANKGDK